MEMTEMTTPHLGLKYRSPKLDILNSYDTSHYSHYLLYVVKDNENYITALEEYVKELTDKVDYISQYLDKIEFVTRFGEKHDQITEYIEEQVNQHVKQQVKKEE